MELTLRTAHIASIFNLLDFAPLISSTLIPTYTRLKKYSGFSLGPTNTLAGMQLMTMKEKWKETYTQPDDEYKLGMLSPFFPSIYPYGRKEVKLQPLMTFYSSLVEALGIVFVIIQYARHLKLKDCNTLQRNSFVPSLVKLKGHGEKISIVSFALPETAASVAVAATVVGAAATLLVRRTRASAVTEAPSKPCEDCGGSGICAECKGEGFTLKKLSDGSAEKARLNAKNMATRYTAALPKKWSYCTKCSSARSCSSCGGSGKISL